MDERGKKVKPNPTQEKTTRPVVSYTIKGTNKLLGALVKCPKSEKGQRVAQIVYLYEEEDADTRVKGELKVQVSWYYWPEETAGGKQPFYGKKELIKANDHDIVSPDDILDLVYVRSLDDHINREHVGPEDYFVRFCYDTSSGFFSPSLAPVFCKCEMPVNPDDFMLQCDVCHELYHPSCIDMTIDEAEKLDTFVCCNL